MTHPKLPNSVVQNLTASDYDPLVGSYTDIAIPDKYAKKLGIDMSVRASESFLRGLNQLPFSDGTNNSNGRKIK